MGAFMASFTKDLTESGELVDTKGLTAPLHARRIQLRGGVPVVTDGPPSSGSRRCTMRASRIASAASSARCRFGPDVLA
jgi:hypothetical protein